MTDPSERPGFGRAPDMEADIAGQVMRASIERRLFPNARPAVRIGRFMLLERIGSGGMGDVYSAYDEHLERRVAIKLVRNQSGAGASERLLREAKALARLSHPNVVQVYDAGTVESQVFVAMELIQGRNLRAWLEERTAGPRLEPWQGVRDIFLHAGAGLEAAHQAGLAHRDFKPENVLIGDDGRVAVVDFGLARLVAEQAPPASEGNSEVRPVQEGGPAVSAQTRVTATGALIGTPAYLSPEQIRGHTGDARSDQFSFCVSLYEALLGVRPFPVELAEDRLRAIEARQLAEPTAGRNVPVWLRQALVRGMSPQPEERFSRMDDLLAALARDKRRRKRGVGVAAVLVCTGVAIGGGASLGFSREPCLAAGQTLDTVWNESRRTSLEGAFQGTGLGYAADTWARVREQVDDQVARLRAARVDACEDTYVRHVQPDRVLALRSTCLERGEKQLDALLGALTRTDASTLAQAVESLGALPDPDLCRDSEALLLGVQPPENAEIAARVASLRTELEELRALELAGRSEEALARAEPLLNKAQATGYPPVRAEALFLAGRLSLQRDTGEAVTRGLSFLWDALDLAESQRHDQLAAEIWNQIVYTASRRDATQDRPRELSRRALAAVQRLAMPGQTRIDALANLGSIHYRALEYEQAESAQTEALKLARAQAEHGPAGRLRVARRLQDLANTLADRARPEEARALYQEALETLRSALGERHPAVARLGSDFAIFLYENGDLETARALLEKSVDIATAALGARHYSVGVARLVLANIEQERGRLEIAEAHARAGLDIYVASLGASHPDVAEAWQVLGLIRFRENNPQGALEAWRQALEVQRASLGDGPEGALSIAVTRSNIAEALVALGKHPEALKEFTDIEPVAREHAEEFPMLQVLVLKGRAEAYLGQSRPRVAEPLLEQALSILAEQPGHPLEHADVAWALARARRALGREETATRTHAERAASLYEQAGRTQDVARIRAWLAHGTP